MELVTGHAGSTHITAEQVSRLLKGATATDSTTVQRLNVGNLAALSYADATMEIATGEMLLNGFHVTFEESESIPLDATVESTNSRIDKIVLEIIQDNTTSYQTAELVIVQGEEAETPTAPDTPTEPDLSTQEFLAVGVIAQVTVTADAITAFTDYTDLYGGNYATVSDFESIWESNNILGAKNLIPYPYYHSDGRTSRGMTFTVEDDGVIYLNGTPDGTGQPFFNLITCSASYFTLKAGTSYILSCDSNSDYAFSIIYFYDESATALSVTYTYEYEDGTTGTSTGSYISLLRSNTYHEWVKFTPTTDVSYYQLDARFTADTSQTASDVYEKIMLRLAADTDDTYEPYAMTNSKLTDVAREVPYYATSSTAASTTAKVATTNQSGFSLTTGCKVIVKFTYTNTASAPTLNVNSTGAKTIYGYGTTTPSLWWLAGDVVEFTYDGTNWLMQPTQGQVETINSNLTNLNNTVTQLGTNVVHLGGANFSTSTITLSDSIQNYKYICLTINATDGTYTHSKHELIPTSLVQKRTYEFQLSIYGGSSYNTFAYFTFRSDTSYILANYVVTGWTSASVDVYGIN